MPENPNTPNPADDTADVIKIPKVVSAAGRWLFGQEANTVALFLLLGMFAAGFKYGVPFIVEHGREMHREVIESHRSDRKEDREQHKAERAEDRERRTKDLDRWSRASEKQTAAIESANALLRELVVETKRDRGAVTK